MTSPINQNQTKPPLSTCQAPLVDTPSYDTGINTGTTQATQDAGFLSELYNWYTQATAYYQQVQAGTVVEPDVAGLIEQLNYAYNTLSQAGYGMDTLPGTNGGGTNNGLPDGAIMGAHNNYVYNEFGPKNINYTGGEGVDTSDIWVGPGGSLTLNIAATSADVSMSFVNDDRSNPPKKVLQIKVHDQATGHEHTYYVQDYENINPSNFFINTATGHINDTTGQNLATVGVYDGSSVRPPEYEGQATVTQNGPNEFNYSVAWGDSITFRPMGGVDQIHNVYGPANIYVDPQAKVDVYLGHGADDPSGYTVVVTHPDGTHDTFHLQAGYQFDIGAHENQVTWHEAPGSVSGMPRPGDLTMGTSSPNDPDDDLIDESKDDGILAGNGLLADAPAGDSIDEKGIGSGSEEEGLPEMHLNLDAFELPEGWLPEDGNDPNVNPDPQTEPEPANDSKPDAAEVDPFDPYAGRPHQTTTGSDIPPEFQQDFLFQGVTGTGATGSGDAAQETPPPAVIDLAAMLGIDPLDIPHISEDGRNFWDIIQAGVLPPNPDVLNIISYLDKDLRNYISAYQSNPDGQTAGQIRDRLVGILQSIYGDDALQAKGPDDKFHGLTIYFKGENGELLERNINFAERNAYGETFWGVTLSKPGISDSGSVGGITANPDTVSSGIPEGFQEMAMSILFPGDTRNYDELYGSDQKKVDDKAKALMADYKSKTGHDANNIPSPPDYKTMRWLLENDSTLRNSFELYVQTASNPYTALAAVPVRATLIIRLNQLLGGGFDGGSEIDQITVGGQTFDFFTKGQTGLNAFNWDEV